LAGAVPPEHAAALAAADATAARLAAGVTLSVGSSGCFEPTANAPLATTQLAAESGGSDSDSDGAQDRRIAKKQAKVATRKVLLVL
jgi:hypothetical protein